MNEQQDSIKLKEEILASLQETKEKLHGAHDDDGIIIEVFNSLYELILNDRDNAIKQSPHMYQSVITMLTNIQSRLSENMQKHYIKAFQFIYSGVKSGYYVEIEQYIVQYKGKYGDFTYDDAYNDILEVIDCFAENDDIYSSHIKKLSSVLSKHMPESAFYAYVKYLTKTCRNQNKQIKALRQILEIDENWYAVHAELGGIYSSQGKWQKAIECYETAVTAGEIYRTDMMYFSIALCYFKTRQYLKCIEYYKKCLEITPDFQSANNYLGVAYKKLKDYNQALQCFSKSIALGTDGSHPFRNKLETLIKLERNKEAVAFAAENPTYFKSKHYKKIMEKAAVGQGNMDVLSAELEKTTENEHAGTVTIDEGSSGLQLYAHQQAAHRDMSRKILNDKFKAGLLVLPTGGGKTLTATYWIMGNILDRDQKIIWLAHRHELLNQARSSFEKVSYSDIAHRKKQYNFRVISGQHDRPVHIKPSDDVIIASKTSLCRGFSYLSDKWLSPNNSDVFLVIDEAHHATAKEYRNLIDNIRDTVPSVKVLGLTATPFRTAESEQGLLKKIFHNDIIYKIDMRELISREILATPIFEEVKTEVDMLKLFQTSDGAAVLERIEKESFFDIDSIGAEIAVNIAENAERNSIIIKKYNKDKYGQTLVFALNVNMAIALNKLFNDNKVKSDYVVSDIKDMATGVTYLSKENKEKIQKFRDGELEVLINVNILTEGTDLPNVQTVFLTRPTKSTILMTQMIGRGLRGLKAGGTKDCYIVSFVDDWQNRIAWVNPERLFIDENADFDDHSAETRKMAMRLVAIQKIEEFAAIADGTLDERLGRLNFIERIPVGLYKFSYLVPMEDEEDEVVNCDVLVYDCMQKAYQELLDWLPVADLHDENAAIQHINDTLFTETDRLVGYRKQDIADIIAYYKQTEGLPEFIAFTERAEYDIGRLAKHVISERLDVLTRQEFIKNEWNKSNSRWSAFYGINNQKAFRKTINDEIDKILYPEDYKATHMKPLTQKELLQIQDLPLYEIRQSFPELGEKIRSSVFEKFTDSDGLYFSAQSGYKSRNKLDFQIDHIVPMAKGGKTVLENLQLLKRSENLIKGTN